MHDHLSEFSSMTDTPPADSPLTGVSCQSRSPEDPTVSMQHPISGPVTDDVGSAFRDILGEASVSTASVHVPTSCGGSLEHNSEQHAPGPVSSSLQRIRQPGKPTQPAAMTAHVPTAGGAAESADPAASCLDTDVRKAAIPASLTASGLLASECQTPPGVCEQTGIERPADRHVHDEQTHQPSPISNPSLAAGTALVNAFPTADEALRWESLSHPSSHHGNKTAAAAATQPPQDAGEVFEATLERLMGVWTKPRVKSDWSLATWHAEENAAEVNVNNCKFLSRMGFARGRRRLLYIEEALYLVSRCDMVLAVPDASVKATSRRAAIRPLSLQESYGLLIRSGFPIEAFQVYCHLSRAGYLVFRDEQHPPTKGRASWSTAPTSLLPPPLQQERQAALLKRLQSRMPNLRPMQRAAIDITVEPHEVVFNVFKPNSKFSRNKQVVPDYRVALAREKLPSTEALEAADTHCGNVPLLYAIVNTGDVDYFNLCDHVTPLAWKT